MRQTLNSNTKQTKRQWKTKRWVDIIVATVTKINVTAKTSTIVKYQQGRHQAVCSQWPNWKVLKFRNTYIYPIPSHKRASTMETQDRKSNNILHKAEDTKSHGAQMAGVSVKCCLSPTHANRQWMFSYLRFFIL